MMEKINWYREVLELEPNSKVFFPLAKLLVKDNRRQEAVETLEAGLTRHPEYLEARLFLIEILYQDHRQDLCSQQVRQLSSMFASYAGFWQAWAACLADQPDEADTASILHFIAARFIAGPLLLHDVINRGIASIISEHTKEDSPAVHPGETQTSSAEKTVQPVVAVAEVPENNLQSEDIAPENDGENPGLTASDTEAETFAEQAMPAEERAAADVMPDEDASTDVSPAAEETSGPEVNVEEIPQETISEELSGEDEEKKDDELITPIIAVAEVQERDEPGYEEDVNAEPEDGSEENNNINVISEQDRNADMAENTVEENPQTAIPMSAAPEDIKNAGEDAHLQDDSDNSAVAGVVAATSPEELAMMEQIDELEPPSQPDAENIVENAPETDMDELSPEDGTQEIVQNIQTQLAPETRDPRLTASQTSHAVNNEDDGEETFSLRTRSMAEVLAEQGDIQGALDIYQELAAAAVNPDESTDIRNRMATLKSRLGYSFANNEMDSLEQPKESQTSGDGKEKLIGMLEALAHRVEARVGN